MIKICIRNVQVLHSAICAAVHPSDMPCCTSFGITINPWDKAAPLSYYIMLVMLVENYFVLG